MYIIINVCVSNSCYNTGRHLLLYNEGETG